MRKETIEKYFQALPSHRHAWETMNTESEWRAMVPDYVSNADKNSIAVSAE
jgi:hypothetical protein